MIRKRIKKSRRTKARRLQHDSNAVALGSALPTMAEQKKQQQLGAYYAGRPAITLGTTPEVEKSYTRSQLTNFHENKAEVGQKIRALPDIHGKGKSHSSTVYGRTNIRLKGQTKATFKNSFRTQDVQVRKGSDCDNCSGRKCVHVTGILVASYTVTTQVTLPSVSDFPGLTPCQQGRVQDAISNELAPHEQEHVRAFQQYNGTTRQNFNLTMCRSDLDSAIQAMFDTEENSRRKSAQAASDVLDPFHIDVDLNCKDESTTAESSQGPP